MQFVLIHLEKLDSLPRMAKALKRGFEKVFFHCAAEWSRVACSVHFGDVLYLQVFVNLELWIVRSELKTW